jgi:hypothetical protein
MIGDDFFGLGLPEAVHVATWADLCTALQRTLTVSVPGDAAHVARMAYLSPFVDRQTPARNFFAAILEHFDGWIRPRDGQLEAGQFPHDGITPTGLPELSYHDFVSHPDFDSPGLADVYTDADVVHLDRDLNMEEISTPGMSTSARERLGEYRPQTYQRPFVCTSYQGREQANELAKFYARPEETATVSIRRERVGSLHAGDRFVLNDAPNAATLIVRITERVDSAAGGEVTLSLVAERGLAPLTHVAPADVSPRLADPALVSIVNARMFQLPAKFAGEADPIPAVVALAQRPAAHVAGFNLNFSDADVTYDELSPVSRWALRGTLAAAITSGATTFTLNAAGSELALLQAQSDAARDDDALLLFVDFEILSIGGVTALGGGAYSLTVLRGRRGSAAASHLINAPAYVIPREDLAIFQHAKFPRTSSTRYFKLASFTADAEEALSTALKLTFAFDDTTVDAPTGVTAVAKAEAIYLSWSLPTLPDGSPDQTIQMVEIWEKASGASAPSAGDPWDLELLGTGINRGGLTAGTAKDYYLRCRDSINTKSAIVGPYSATALAAATGPTGPTGPGLVYVGTYAAGAVYYKTAERTDVVLYSGNYYPAANAAKSGLTTWGTPGGADWGAAFTNFKAVATDLLLTVNATITKTLVMGDGATASGGIIRSAGATAYGTGAGFWMNPRNGSNLTEFRVGDPAGSFLAFDGTAVTAVLGGAGSGQRLILDTDPGSYGPNPPSRLRFGTLTISSDNTKTTIALTDGTMGVSHGTGFTIGNFISFGTWYGVQTASGTAQFKKVQSVDGFFDTSGNRLVDGSRKASVAAAGVGYNAAATTGTFAGSDTLSLSTFVADRNAIAAALNDHGARINDLIARLKVTGGHGLIAD